jgi:hypothetical protein
MIRFKGILLSILASFFLLTAILPALAVDTDGDGLADDVEARLGSSPRHKDIFVYINSFVWNGKNLKPRGNFSQIVKSVFSTAPVTNPDGTTGINLHVEMGPNIKTNTILASWEDFDFFKDQYLPSSKRGTHHYCLFVGEMNINGELSISGISRNGAVFKQGASDFMVALGHPAWFNYPTAPLYKWTQAGTFIHELGHNLGFMHGGADHISYKPNHLSLMSYAYQTDGIPITVPGQGLFYLYDYARFAGPNLNEGNLNEVSGMGQKVNFEGTPYGARWFVTDGRTGIEVFDASSNVDWNDDGLLRNGVRQNLNRGFDDKVGNLRGGVVEWSRVFYKGGLIGKGAVQAKSSLPSDFLYPCMKVSERPAMPMSGTQNVPRVTFQDLQALRKKK